MPFGFKTVGATFQHVIQTTFADYLMGNVSGHSDAEPGFCMPYVDDLCTQRMSYAEALYRYEKIFQRTVQVGIQFEPSKCTFFAQTVEVPGQILAVNERLPNPKKSE